MAGVGVGIGVISPLTQLLKSCVECAFGNAGIEAGGLTRCFPALTVRGIKEEETREQDTRANVSRVSSDFVHLLIRQLAVVICEKPALDDGCGATTDKILCEKGS